MSDDAPTGPTTNMTPQRGQAPADAPQGERLLWWGDRVPDFVLPDPQGQLRFFYQTVTGAPTVLVLAVNTARQDQWDEIKGFAAAAPALREAGAELMIVSNDGVESLAMVAKIIPEHALWLADIRGVVNLGLRTAALFPFTGVACFLLDGNQRAIAIRGPEPGQADWALAMLKSRPSEPPQRLATVAPVLLLPGVLDGEDCLQLLNQISATDSASGSAPIGEQELAERISKLLLRRIGPEVEKAFSFDDFVFESIMLRWDGAASPSTADRRREIDDPAVQGRPFSLILDLADGAYESGDIMFPEYGPHSYRPGTGGALVFAGTLLRELRAVSAGRRSLLVATLRRPAAAGGAAPPP
jgi:hypothetical protein